jgi:hypothetical protein
MDNLSVFSGNLNSLLLIDSRQDNAERIEQQLCAYKIQLIAAENAEEALAFLANHQPDVIIVNDALPAEQRKALLQALHSHPKASHIPIILLSQHLSPMANNDRHLDRLLKPINPNALIKLLHTYAKMLACRKVVSALHNHHDQLLEAKNEGILGLNHLGQIVYANNAACRLLNFKPSALLEIYIESLFESQSSQVGSQWSAHPIAKICEDKNILQVEKSFFWKGDGTQLPVKFAAVPIFDEPLISIVLAFQLRKTSAEEQRAIEFDAQDFADDALAEQALAQAQQLLEKPVQLHDATPSASLSKQALNKQALNKQSMNDTQTVDINIDALPAAPTTAAELVLNDYLQKVYDAAPQHNASVIYLFQVNHWRHLLEGLGREVMPHVIKAVRNSIQQQLPAMVAVDYLESGQFCVLATTAVDAAHITEHAQQLQSVLAKPLQCLDHTLFLSICVGATALENQALPQVLFQLQQALLLSQDATGDGICVFFEDQQAGIIEPNASIVTRQAMTINPDLYPLSQTWLRQQSPELQLRPFFDLQNNMIMGLNVTPLYEHPTLGWQELDVLCTHYRSSPDFIAVAKQMIELFMQRLAQELRGEDLPATCQICLKIPAALLGVTDFYAGFIHSIAEAGIASESLWIELPESSWRVNSPIFLANIKALHLHGIGLVISEFGQALAPLALLDKLPISAIKLASKITDHADLYRDKAWLKALKELSQNSALKLWATQFTKQSRSMLVSQLGITLTDGPSFEFSESGLSVAEFYALTQEVCLNSDVVE